MPLSFDPFRRSPRRARVSSCRGALAALLLLLTPALWPALASAQSADLQVSQHDVSPDPVGRGASSDFTIRITNNGPAAANGAVVTITVAPRYEVLNQPGTSFPATCTLSGAVGAQQLSCPQASFASGADTTFQYRAVARVVGASTTRASIAPPPGVSDPNSANDALDRVGTVRAGVDFSVTKSAGASSYPGAGTVTYTLVPRLAGPDTTASLRVTDALPPQSDLNSVTASGSSWSCSVNTGVPNVVCTYTGAAPAVGSLPLNLPSITVTGRVARGISGTISNSAFATVTDPQVSENNPSNDSSGAVVVDITPGTDLRAQKSMAPNPVSTGQPLTLTLGIRNDGPATVNAAQIVDTVPAGFTIGTLPAGCSAAGQTVTCVSGTISGSGATQSFAIPLTAPGAAETGNNSASVTPPAGITDPVPGNDTASVAYQVQAPYADLIAAKSKTPGPIAAGQTLVSTIRLTNNAASLAAAAYTAATPLRVTDQIGANEQFTGVVTAGWSCTPSGSPAAPGPATITCQTTGSGSIARGSFIELQLNTQPLGIGASPPFPTLTNTACVGTTAGSGHQPPDPNSSNDCSSAGSVATTRGADLAIVKEVNSDGGASWAGAVNLPASDDDFYIRLSVSNLAGDVAPTVEAVDTLPNYLNAAPFTTAISVVSVESGNCTISGGTIRCSFQNLAAGETRRVILRVQRPFESGTSTNTATVSSPDTVDPTPGNNQGSAGITAAAVADVVIAADGKNVNPNPVTVGQLATYTISYRNAGPNTADGVVVSDTVDLTRFEVLPGSISTTRSGSSCSLAGNVVSCSVGTLQRAQNFQMSFQVRPRYPFGVGGTSFPVNHTNTATISTTTFESNSANNSDDITHAVSAPQLDLLIDKGEPAGGDPLAFEDPLVYRIRIQNDGPSRATAVAFVDTPSPPAGYSMTPSSATLLAGSSSYAAGRTPVCTLNAPGANQVRCVMDAAVASSFLDSGEYATFEIVFASTGTAPSGSLTYGDAAVASSAEGAAGHDLNAANDSSPETTTILPRTDLEVVTKTTVTGSPVDINQPVTFTLQLRNNGPSSTPGLRLVETLPPGFVRTATAISAVPDGGSAVTIAATNCTGTSTLTCDLAGSFPPGAANTLTLTVEARAQYPYSGAVGSAVTNSATIEPGRDVGGDPLSRDSVAANNTKTSTVTVRASSLAGRVYADANGNDAFDAGEQIVNVRVTLSGTDAYGNAIPAGVFVNTNASGVYSFPNLPPGNYTLTETQPADHFDDREFAGSVGAGATAANTAIAASICPPAGNCGGGAAQNVIASIALPAGTAATGYDFQEIREAALSGYVYVDANNDGQRGGGESGIDGGVSAVSLRLTGTDYAGNAVNLLRSINGSGAFAFNDLPPSDGSGYTLTEVAEPAGYIDGRDQNGAGAGNVLAGSAGRAPGETLVVGVVAPGANLTERNFGELRGATLAGSVYVDTDGDAIRDGGETAGVSGVTVTLTGSNDLGQAIDCPVQTQANGSYAFPVAASSDPLCQVLRPGSYTLTQSPAAGLTTTGAHSGSLGGGGQPPNQPLLGATAIGSVNIVSGSAATNYDFGVQGQGLSGSVYVDRDGNGQRDAGEPGIAGVTITLSGTTAGGQDVCVVISPSPCTAVTDASGSYQFLNLPASNGAGYTLREQTQSSAPLNNWADGAETVGRINGAVVGSAAADDTLSGVVIGTGELGVGYDFGERPASLGGHTWLDLDGDGVRDAGETGLGGVVITLSGTTADGRNVCTLLPSCTFTTAADGSYRILDLPAGTYVLTQTQPTNYADGAESPGNFGGTPGGAGTSVIGAIVVPPGGIGNDYDFGELTAGLTGRVCLDVADDACQAGDPGLADVNITLTGTAADGSAVSRSATTAADGSYAFTSLPTPNAQGYTLTQTQPAGHASAAGNTSVGTAGGSAANDTIANIPLAGGAAASGYDFGELRADLSLTKSVTPARLNIGQRVTFTVAVSNAGPTRTTGVTVSDRLPAGFVYESSNATLGSYDAASGAWTIGALSASQAATLTIVAVTQPAGPYRNTAEVATSNVPDPDSTPGNDQASEDDQAAAEVVALAVVTGSVWEDRNGNAIRDPGEPPFVDLPVLVTDSTGVAQTVRTDADGNYRADVAPGATTLDPTPPPGVRLTTGNDPQSVTVAASPTPTPSPPVGYQSLGSVSGSVWADLGSTSRQRDAGDQPLAGWIVELVDPAQPAGSTPLRTATTDASGAYAFTEVPAGTYRIQFRDPSTRVVYGTPVNGESGTPQGGSRAAPGNERGALEVTVVAGANLPQQSLPVDPSGVVYDSVSRDLVAGATVTLRPVGACAGYDPATQIVNASAGGYTIAGNAISMTTSGNGYYQFLFGGNAPAACTFELVVTPPGQYVFPSSLIPASEPLDVPAGLGTIAIQPQAGAPSVGQSTTWHQRLVIGSARNGVIHNHIPLDTVGGSQIALEKNVDRREAELGDSALYTLRLRNVRGSRLPVLSIDDRLPLGFRFIPGTARVRLPGASAYTAQPDPAGGVGPRLTFNVATGLPAGAELSITYRVRLGVGAQEGDGVNRAQARSGAASSNLASARVRVQGGVFTTEACVAGKIWLDCNENQLQDPEEVGVPGVRLYFEDGTYLVSDSEGKYSYCGLKPITHVLKVDRQTLPKGAWLGTTGSRNVGDPDSLFVDLRNGELHRADFRIASCHDAVRDQVLARRPAGEVAAPEVEKGEPQAPVLTLDPTRQTRCEAPRHERDAVYREAPTDCAAPPPESSR